MGLRPVSDLTLLLKYLSGRLPLSDFEIDFGRRGTAMDMLNLLFECLGKSINALSRPVDAIKHQAKTVTVGTSRVGEKFEGLVFESLSANRVSPIRLTHGNIMVLKNLQGVILAVNGSILYRIDGLNLLGEPTEETTISIVRKHGLLSERLSRVEKDPALKGTKRIIVRQGNVYIGKGLKDGQNILIVPVLSDDSSAPRNIAQLLLLNISFKDNAPLATIVNALGGKYEHIKNIVQESNITWQDHMLTILPLEDIFGRSAEKIADAIKLVNQEAQNYLDEEVRADKVIFTDRPGTPPSRPFTASVKPH
jgi:glucosamine--fructose-6-phosphate aminotransferase (isomerizing)